MTNQLKVTIRDQDEAVWDRAREEAEGQMLPFSRYLTKVLLERDDFRVAGQGVLNNAIRQPDGSFLVSSRKIGALAIAVGSAIWMDGERFGEQDGTKETS